MIRYRFTQAPGDVTPGQTPTVATLTMNTTNPREIVDLEFEGDPELVREIQINLKWSWGTRGKPMTINRSTPMDLRHAIRGPTRQVEEFNPERIIDTVQWEDDWTPDKK